MWLCDELQDVVLTITANAPLSKPYGNEDALIIPGAKRVGVDFEDFTGLFERQKLGQLAIPLLWLLSALHLVPLPYSIGLTR